MRAYSQLDLIGQELKKIQSNQKGKDFFSKVLDGLLVKKYVNLNIKLEPEVLVRSQGLCYDLSRELESTFSQADLLQVLYGDFLFYVRRNYDNLPQILQWLVTRDITPPAIEDYSDQTPNIYCGDDELTTISITMGREEALRGEHLCFDLEEVETNHHFTLESLLSIVFTDFVEQYRKGNVKNAAKKILKYVEHKPSSNL